MNDIVVDTPEGIEHFQFARCIAALRVEISTNMRMSRGSTLRHVQGAYGIKARTKKGALAEMLKLYEKRYGRKYGS